MNDQTKLAMALVGGYALGRTKKGRKALSIALVLAGRKYGFRPKEMVVDGLVRLAKSDAATQLVDQVRGPLLEAGKNAAMATVKGGASALTKNVPSATGGSEESEEDEKPRRKPRSTTRSIKSRPTGSRTTKSTSRSAGTRSGSTAKRAASTRSKS